MISALPADIARRVDYLEVATVDQIRLVLENGRRVLWGSVEGSKEKAEVLAVLLERPRPGDRRLGPGPPHHPLTPGGKKNLNWCGAPACCRGTTGPRTYLEYTTSG